MADRQFLGAFKLPASWDEMTKDEQLAWADAVASRMLARIPQPTVVDPSPPDASSADGA